MPLLLVTAQSTMETLEPNYKIEAFFWKFNTEGVLVDRKLSNSFKKDVKWFCHRVYVIMAIQPQCERKSVVQQQ